MELVAVCPGRTFTRVKDYLASFESRWFLLECDPERVIQRERAFKSGEQNPTMDTELVKVMIGNWDELSHFALGTVPAGGFVQLWFGLVSLLEMGLRYCRGPYNFETVKHLCQIILTATSPNY